MKRKISDEALRAIYLGTMCAVAYLAVYLVRNILSAVSPQMLEQAVLNKDTLGTLSSLFFTTYAIGQLINGIIGDKLKARYMLCGGLFLAGVSGVLYAAFAQYTMGGYVAYAFVGFFLSMIYGPMTKLVAENVSPIYVPRCGLGYTFSSLFGSPLAGLTAMMMPWRMALYISAAILIAFGIICFCLFLFFEHRGIIVYRHYERQKDEGGSIGVLIKHSIIRFTIVSILTGVVRTAVVFWLPTYLAEYLGFRPEQAALLFTVTTLIISCSAFLAIFVYERIGRKMEITLIFAFAASAICFLLLFLVKQQAINIILITLAVLFANCAASILWTVYCPSLRDTGMVSSATGFLDFVSYMSASLASTLFANAVTAIGWEGLILVWFGLMTIGVLISIPFKTKGGHTHAE